MFNEDEISLIETKAIQKLKSYREERNLSQFELSLQSGVSQNMITYIETGKRAPTLKTIIKLCDALEISPAKLFEIDNKEKEKAKNQIIEAIKKYM
ncbi:MAG: helix-turn-helix transcriptional regulator [Treponemataceae bacterium]|nr:helix-turn-helix transcriptional regulator [Treponemataceae bacterium]